MPAALEYGRDEAPAPAVFGSGTGCLPSGARPAASGSSRPFVPFLRATGTMNSPAANRALTPLTVTLRVPPLPHCVGARRRQSRRERQSPELRLLAPMKWGRGGSGEARDGEGAGAARRRYRRGAPVGQVAYRLRLRFGAAIGHEKRECGGEHAKAPRQTQRLGGAKMELWSVEPDLARHRSVDGARREVFEPLPDEFLAGNQEPQRQETDEPRPGGRLFRHIPKRQQPRYDASQHRSVVGDGMVKGHAGSWGTERSVRAGKGGVDEKSGAGGESAGESGGGRRAGRGFVHGLGRRHTPSPSRA
jgi:hypothetical protein